MTDATLPSKESHFKALAKEFIKADEQQNGSLPVNLQIAINQFARWLDERSSHETLPPRITVMDDGRAMGGSDVCHTCAAHCTVINDLETALRGLYWDNVDYLTLNKLGGMQNHWMRAARMALGMDVDDVRPTQKAGEQQ